MKEMKQYKTKCETAVAPFVNRAKSNRHRWFNIGQPVIKTNINNKDRLNSFQEERFALFSYMPKLPIQNKCFCERKSARRVYVCVCVDHAFSHINDKMNKNNQMKHHIHLSKCLCLIETKPIWRNKKKRTKRMNDERRTMCERREEKKKHIRQNPKRSTLFCSFCPLKSFPPTKNLSLFCVFYSFYFII